MLLCLVVAIVHSCFAIQSSLQRVVPRLPLKVDAESDWMQDMIDEMNESGQKRNAIPWKKLLSCKRESGNLPAERLVRCSQLTWSLLNPINLDLVKTHLKVEGLDLVEEMIRRVHSILDLLRSFIAEFKLQHSIDCSDKQSIDDYLSFFRSVTSRSSIDDFAKPNLTEGEKMELGTLAEVGWLDEIPNLCS